MNSKINSILRQVGKPARYAGGEYNSAVARQADCNFLMCFPDVYEVGMSNLGIKILYHLLNLRQDTYCDLCFAPWNDCAELLKEHDVRLFGVGSRRAMSDFDLVGFSLQSEMCYTNVLMMLDLGGVPLLASQRGEDDPIVVAGGPCTVNPYPVADFFDLILIGDGEIATDKLASITAEVKRQGGCRADIIRRASQIQGMWATSLSSECGVRRSIIDDLDSAFFPTAPIVSSIEAVHNRGMLEVFRGCTQGCRFCQAGMIYRPVRERSADRLYEQARAMIDSCGYEEISLSSLSTCDYSDLSRLLKLLKPLSEGKKTNFSLPSTRIDSFSEDFVATKRLSSLTFAPEAATQRLRDVINKSFGEEQIFGGLRSAFAVGYTSLKLYFMIGLPTETDEDVLEIANLCRRIRALYRQVSTSKKSLNISVSAATFVPKPFTPFECVRQIEPEVATARQNALKQELRKLGIRLSYSDNIIARLECCLSRGDRRMGGVILQAYRNGCTFDSWTECFDYARWQAAFDACGISTDEYTSSSVQPVWHTIDIGVSKQFLAREYDRALEGIVTEDCRKGCHGCSAFLSCRGRRPCC